MPRGDNPNSRKNLIDGHRLNSETASIAGKISGKRRAARKTFREQFEAELEALISQRDKNGNIIAQTTVKDAITKQIVQKALKGNTRAFELIRDTIGEKPSETIVVTDIDPEVVREVEAMVNDS